uniref:MCM10 OB-fold domain-containing protein n=1 Tax=Fagus sylvatica TaxID=28930 RepID=A0A2N9ISX9_FAGSY
MSNHQDDLDLLLSLQDRVLETPPGSPSAPHPSSPGYLSDDGLPKRTGQADMSVFRDAVQDCLDYEPEPAHKAGKLKGSKTSNAADVEKFSGLRIRNLLVGDTLSGCWATVGVLTEKGTPKTSSTGKNYSIWKVGSLDENTVSLFLFGDAYQRNSKEQAGTVFALFNCAVRKDAMGAGFSLSVYSPSQILKIGTSVDYGVCKGKRKDGMPCTLAINNQPSSPPGCWAGPPFSSGVEGECCRVPYRQGALGLCTLLVMANPPLTRALLNAVGYIANFINRKHQRNIPQRELNSREGRNLRTAFRGSLKSEGIYMVDPLADRTNFKKSAQPVKLLSVEGLKKALRKSSTMKAESSAMRNQQPDAKRKRAEQVQVVLDKTKQNTEKLIELDFVSSDEEL